MIELGQISNIRRNEDIFDVRIPIFEGAGATQHVIIPCKLSYQPGSINGYNIGDVVMVDCVNEDWSTAVIIGKLYKGDEENPTTFHNIQSLQVSQNATLPTDTKIGDLTYQDLLNFRAQLLSLEDKVNRALLGLANIGILDKNGYAISSGEALAALNRRVILLEQKVNSLNKQ